MSGLHDWRRTPPASSQMAFWTSPTNSTAKAVAASSSLTTATAAKRTAGDVFTGVSVKSNGQVGICGVFAVADSAVRWSGRKTETAVRPVLGEVVDSSNKEMGANWTILFSRSTVLRAKASDESANVIIVEVEGNLYHEFSFRNPIEAKVGLEKLQSGHPEIEKAMQVVVTKEKKHSKSYRRRSISFDDVMEDDGTGEDEDESENVNPSRANSNLMKESIERKAIISTGTGSLLGASSQDLRAWVRTYVSGSSTHSEVSGAANHIHQAYGYKVSRENRDQTEYTPAQYLTDKQKRTLQQMTIDQLRKTMEEMRSATAKERARVESETEIRIGSPARSSNRSFTYTCVKTGSEISPNTYTRRYRRKILGQVSPKQDHAVAAGSLSLQTIEPEPDEERFLGADPDSSMLLIDFSTEERVIPSATVGPVHQEVLDSTDLTAAPTPLTPERWFGPQTLQHRAMPETQVASGILIDISTPKSAALLNPSGEQHQVLRLQLPIQSTGDDSFEGHEKDKKSQYERAILLEEAKLHEAFDKALSVFVTRQRELEQQYFGQ